MKKFIIIIVVLFAAFSHANAATLKTSTLRVGSTGETVKVVQQKLSDLGYLVGKVDGKYGRKTADAVARFQKSKNLKADGLAGEKTLSLITLNSLSKKETGANDGSYTCSNSYLSKLSLTDQELFELAQKKQLGQCIIWDHKGLESFCDYYVTSAVAGSQGALGYPKNPASGDSTGCVVAPTLPKGVGNCWGGYDKATMCTDDYVKNAASQIRKAISDNACGCDKNTSDFFSSSDSKPVVVPVKEVQVDVCSNITGNQKSVPAKMIVKDGVCTTSAITTSIDVCDGVDPSVEILSPNGGEVYSVGQPMTIKWKTNCYGVNPVVGFDLATTDSEGGAQNTFLFSATQLSNTGMYTSTLPRNVLTGSDYKIRLFTINPASTGGYDPFYKVDMSDEAFHVVDGIVNPNTTLGVDSQ